LIVPDRNSALARHIGSRRFEADQRNKMCRVLYRRKKHEEKRMGFKIITLDVPGLRMRILLVALAFLIFSHSQQADSQEPADVRNYKARLTELHVKVKAMAERIESEVRGSSNPGTAADDTAALQKQSIILTETRALLRLIRNLSEDLSDAMPRRIEDRPSDRDLPLLSHATSLLSEVLNALVDYLKTKDKAFLGIARDCEKILESIEKLL
jgi:hypothetical protein